MSDLPLYINEMVQYAQATPGILLSDSLAEAGMKTWRHQFAEVLRQESGTRLGQDIEALHDMRVATRRLRASMDVFGRAFDEKTLRPHLKGLRATGRALGKARDMDVFLEKVNVYRESLPTRQQGRLQPLIEGWEAERAEARQAMNHYLDSLEYREFQIAFAKFLQPPEDSISPLQVAGLALPLVIPSLIYTHLSIVMAYEAILPQIKISQLHALRIEFKKLRYTVEFFREVLGQSAKTVIGMFKNMQDHLGDLQDADVATDVLRAWLIRWDEQQSSLPLVKRQAPTGILDYLSYQYAQRQQFINSFPIAWGQFTQPKFQQSIAMMIAKLQT